ncbi:MAG: hypothetical protein LUC44_03270 [Prevotellaceae bacterium]|nr:hypothetical protein [Prevotellaceae bacterium]
MKKLFVLLFFSLALCAQGFAQKTIQEFRDAQARVGDGVAEIHVKPTIVEVELSSTSSFTDSWPLTAEDVSGLSGNVSNIRAWASYLSSQKHECDIIMNPTYLIQSNTQTGGVTVTVTGFPGVFKNWHTATNEDFEWLKSERQWSKNEKEVTAPVLTK